MKTHLDPVFTPETRPYWEGAEQGELRLCTCRSCDRCFFPPSNVCPGCSSKEIDWRVASGRATLYSFVINPQADERWAVEGPMSVAMVKLEEGPMMLSTVVHCPQTIEALRFDMDLRVVFRPYGDLPRVVCFEPVVGDDG